MNVSVNFPPFPASNLASVIVYFAADLRKDNKSGPEAVTIRQYNTSINSEAEPAAAPMRAETEAAETG